MLAVQVGEALGLAAAARLRMLALGGLLHDIGKLSVPLRGADRSRARSTTTSSRRSARTPRPASACCASSAASRPACCGLVLDHHERLDGSGYPRGLAGDELDLETRILAVCDVYDALVSDRVYRAAWSHERALALLRDPAQFDQACVAALERLIAPPFVAGHRRPGARAAAAAAPGSARRA